jgi:Spy/CpxP family protein refolding chaperone
MARRVKFFAELSIAILCLGTAIAQPPPRRQAPPLLGEELPLPPDQRPPHAGPPGRWWDNPEMAKKLGMTTDQVKKMDDIFQQMRFKLIDLNGNLRKEEAVLEPLMQADQPDDGKLLPQIDRVANARAELEKANARLLLSIRHVLTVDQWKKLQLEDPRPPRRNDRRGGQDEEELLQ